MQFIPIAKPAKLVILAAGICSQGALRLYSVKALAQPHNVQDDDGFVAFGGRQTALGVAAVIR